MFAMKSLVAAAAASLLLLPLDARAEGEYELPDAPEKADQEPVYHNSITFGGIYQSSGSAYYGQWNGRINPGFYGLGDFSLGSRDAWDSGGTNYWSAEGHNLGLDDRSVEFKAGQQGSWGIRLWYDRIPFFVATGFRTAWQQRNGTLASGIAPGSLGNGCLNTTPGSGCSNNFANPNSLGSTTVGTERYILGAEGKVIMGDWQVTTSIRHDLKQGTQEGSLVYSNGGPPTPQSTSVPASLSGGPTTAGGKPANTGTFTSALAFFAQPVEYTTDRIDVTAQYNAERLQVLLGYVFMNFDNGEQFLTLQDPFGFTTGFFNTTNTLGLPPGYKSPYPNGAQILSTYSLPPSNNAQQVKAQIGYNLGPTTRVNSNFQFGLMLQNSPFPPSTNTPGASTYPVGPSNSLNGAIDNIFYNLSLTSAPINHLNLRLAYTLDDRSNLTSRNEWNSTNFLDSGGAVEHMNLPFSYERNAIVAEAGYQVMPGTKVTFDYNLDLTHRTYVNTVNTLENAMTAKVRSQLTDNLFGTLSYQFAVRDAQNYNPFGGPNQENVTATSATAQYRLPRFRAFLPRLAHAQRGEGNAGLHALRWAAERGQHQPDGESHVGLLSERPVWHAQQQQRHRRAGHQLAGPQRSDLPYLLQFPVYILQPELDVLDRGHDPALRADRPARSRRRPCGGMHRRVEQQDHRHRADLRRECRLVAATRSELRAGLQPVVRQYRLHAGRWRCAGLRPDHHRRPAGRAGIGRELEHQLVEQHAAAESRMEIPPEHLAAGRRLLGPDVFERSEPSGDPDRIHQCAAPRQPQPQLLHRGDLRGGPLPLVGRPGGPAGE